MEKEILSVGIDVSKSKLDACLLKKGGVLENLQVANNSKGMLSLVENLQEREATPVVIEATGGYHYGITFFLQGKGFSRVFVINPLITKKHLQGAVRKLKTDKADAKVLAKIGLLEKLDVYQENKVQIERKRLARLIHFLKKQKQGLSNRISSLKDMGIDGFEVETLEEIKDNLEKKIKQTEKKLLESFNFNPVKIRGVSELHHKAIVAELGNWQRFSNRRQIVAFAGMDPSVKESGSSVKGKGRLSKRGSKTLRYYLFQSAWGVMMHNEKYKEYYDKKRSEGKHYFSCLSAIARKLLCEIYSDLKKNNSYNI